MIDDNLNEEIVAGYFRKGDDDVFDLVVPFDTDDPEFARGFMAGQAWQLIELGTPGFEMVITSDNLFMFFTMAEEGGYLLEMEETGKKAKNLEDADWLRISLTKIEDK